MRVAIVHDWLVGGGAERVVQELHNMYPDAPIFTSYCTDEWRRRLDGKVVTGYLQKWPFSKLRKFLPILRIWWFTHLDLDDYDLVISSSGAEAKGIRLRRKGQRVEGVGQSSPMHVNYCHAPTHYYWARYNEYLRRPGFGKFDPLARLGLKLLVGPLRWWDYRAAQRPDYIIANSTHTQAMIKKYYKRDSVVIFPPIDIARFKGRGEQPRYGFVTAGRQTHYKKLDLAVAACTQLNLPLRVIGHKGPEYKRLRRLAGRSVTFLTHVSDEEMADHFQTALGFIFPGEDDFGIVPVEAMAAGTPVIAYKGGGALDYVVEGKTGTFFTKLTVESLVQTLSNFEPNHYKHDIIRTQAENFAPPFFRTTLKQFIADKIKDQ